MKFNPTLYLVTDSAGLDEAVFLDRIRSAIQGGVTLVQLREKDRTSREYLELAVKVKRITDSYGVPLIIDDRLDIAMACDAGGVHLGQSDLPVHIARRIWGGEKIVGATAKTVEQAKKAEEEGADYLGVGAIYPTTTKVVTVRTEVGVLRDICESVGIPVVAIGGLNALNIGILKNIPVSGIAVVSAIMKNADCGAAARELRNRFSEIWGLR